jgi:hypothetical protein
MPCSAAKKSYVVVSMTVLENIIVSKYLYTGLGVILVPS